MDELTCFMDITRFCGPDCCAYLTAPPSNSQSNCLLLVQLECVGKHLPVIADSLTDMKTKLSLQERNNNTSSLLDTAVSSLLEIK